MDSRTGPSTPRHKTEAQLAKQRERRRRQRYNRRDRKKMERAINAALRAEDNEEDWEDVDSSDGICDCGFPLELCLHCTNVLPAELRLSSEAPRTRGSSMYATQFGEWKNIQFRPPTYRPEQVLVINRLEDIKSGIEKSGIKKLEFARSFNVQSDHLNTIAQASPAFCKGLRIISCGDASRSTSHKIEITDKGLQRFVKACPNLEHIRLLNCTRLTEPLQYIIKHCPKIQSITITAKAGSNTALGLTDRKPGPLDDLYEKKWDGYRMNLRYMEFHGLWFDMWRKDFFALLTMSRKHLDIVVGPIDPPIVALFSRGDGKILEGQEHLVDELDEKRTMRRLARMMRDPELERYGAYDEVDEEDGDLFGSDSDDFYDDDELTYEECALRGYYDEDYNPYSANGDVDIDFLRAHGYY